MIKSVVFDLGNVLVDFCWEDLCEKLGFTKKQTKKIGLAVVNNEVWKENDRGEMSEDEVLEKFISAAPDYEEEIRKFYDNIGGVIREASYTSEWIAQLKEAGYKVYALSNFPEKVYELGKENLAFLDNLDGYLLSYREHMVKPEEGFYKLLFEKYDINPYDSVFIDDLKENVEEAIELGMTGIVFENKEQAKEELSKILEEGKKSLLERWRGVAYNTKTKKKDLKQLWEDYFLKEKDVYIELLSNPDEEVKGTVAELAEKYHLSIMDMTGFLDGIDESLVTPNPIEEMDEDTVVSLKFDKEKLFKNMVDAKAEWLYGLEQWNDIFDEEKQKELYREQKKSGTVVNEVKIGRNDPCPCGSGKKYKYCCGKNA